MRSATKKSRKFAKELRRKLTNAEAILWSRLRRHPTHKFRRQHPIGRYIADFACVEARVVIEVDGATHSSEAELDHDHVRAAYMKRQGWRTVRVLNDDVYRCLNDVLDWIESEIKGKL
ncbi:MAG: endonuclease domain-containing protein [Rhizomicrobium sp.]